MSPLSQILAEDNDQIYKIYDSDRCKRQDDTQAGPVEMEYATGEFFNLWSTAPGFRQRVRTDKSLALCFSSVLRPTVRKPFVYLGQGAFSVVFRALQGMTVMITVQYIGAASGPSHGVHLQR
jgi:hypothetical protein